MGAGWKVTLTLEGPVLTHSTSMGLHGIDAVMAARNGCYYLPRTLVKGRLKEAWQQLHSADPSFQPRIDAWMGEETGNRNSNKTWDPERGLLHFTDFTTKRVSDDVPVAQRIRVDAKRGAVARGALLTMESPWAAREGVSFEGSVYFMGPSPESDSVRQYIEIGLRWITNFGAERTAGFGRVADVAMEPVAEVSGARAAKKRATEVKGGVIGMALSPEEPFIVSKRRVSDNLFESEDFIPGTAIKGAMAAMLNAEAGRRASDEVGPDSSAQHPVLCRNFTRMRVTHAFPDDGRERKRAVRMPESLVRVGGITRDVALTDGPLLIGDRAPAFAIDWKPRDFGEVQPKFGWPDLAHEVRVRTAMDYESRRAKDEALFGFEMVKPNGTVRWHASISLPGASDEETERLKVEIDLLLRGGLSGLGKTKTRCGVEFSEPADPAVGRFVGNATIPVNGESRQAWVVTLQTPALVCGEAPFLAQEGAATSNAADALLREYDEAFRRMSGRCLRVRRVFARQSLAGGAYLYMRNPNRGPYRPWLLTDAGSVFVLYAESGCNVKAAAMVGEWEKNGLEREPGDWRVCPYVKENGFGEIAVNLACHQDWKPQEGEYRYV